MRLSLFLLTFLATLSAHAAVTIPDGHTEKTVDASDDTSIGSTYYVDDFVISTPTGGGNSYTRDYGTSKYTFVLSEDKEMGVATTEAALMINGTGICITSDSDAPASLSMTGLENVRVLSTVQKGSSTAPNVYQWTGLKNVTLQGNSVSNYELPYYTSISSTSSQKVVSGAISLNHVYQNASISGNSGDVLLDGNSVLSEMANYDARGAAISANGFYGLISLNDNAGKVTISNNTVKATESKRVAYGGALYLANNGQGISVSRNGGCVEITGNKAVSSRLRALGGAAVLQAGELSILDNEGGVRIVGNSAVSELTSPTDAEISTAKNNFLAQGGAISTYNTPNAGVNISDNRGAVTISDNKATTGWSGAEGGAIEAGYVTICGNTNAEVTTVNDDKSTTTETYSVKISGNYTEASTAADSTNTKGSQGGAFSVGHSNSSLGSALQISGNEKVIITGNHADAHVGSARGGAVYADLAYGKVEISGNAGAVDISNNWVSGADSALGGAIYTVSGVFIEGNESVTLSGNYEKVTDATTGEATYRLRSIYQYNTSTTTNTTQLAASQFRLMAAKDKSIEIQDSVYSNRRKIDVVFNGDYTDSQGVTHKGEGTIRFTGAYTENVLKELKGEDAVTAEEISNSRTSEFASEIKLMGGRLEVADQAEIKGVGFTAAVDSGAVLSLQNATFTHQEISTSMLQDGIVTFNAGTTLEVVGTGNAMTAKTLEFNDKSAVKFVYSDGIEQNAALSYTGNLSMNGESTIVLSGFAAEVSTAQRLISMQGGELQGWNTENLTFVDEKGASLNASHFAWANGVLYYKTSAKELVWNGGNNGTWDNSSTNWLDGSTSHSDTTLEDVQFSGNGSSMENVTLEGNLAVRNLSVLEGGSYTYAESESGSSLTVTGDFTVASGASADIQLAGGVRVDSRLNSAGALKTAKITGYGDVVVTGGSLELADATNAIDVTGDISISNAELRGTWSAKNLSVNGVKVISGADIALENVTIASTLETSGNLALNGGVTIQEGGSIKYNSGTLALGTGSEVSYSKITKASDGKVQLQGSGTLNLGNSYTHANEYSFDQEKWTGRVKLAGITGEKSCLSLYALGNIISNNGKSANTPTIELENCEGYAVAKNGEDIPEISANLVLTKSIVGEEEKAAFRILDGYSSQTDTTYIMNTFTGTVSGEGKMVYDAAFNEKNYTGCAFTGNVSGWTGSFEMGEKGLGIFNLKFAGSASTIKAAISKSDASEATLKLLLAANSSMNLYGDVQTDTIDVTSTGATFHGAVDTESISAENSTLTFGGNSSIKGDVNAKALTVKTGATLSADQITLTGNASLGGTVTLKKLGLAESSTLTVSGNVSIDDEVSAKALTVNSGATISAKKITLSSSATLKGTVTADMVLTDGAAMTLNVAKVTGGITAEQSKLTVSGNSSITGDVVAKEMTVNSKKTISANKITLSSKATITGTVTADMVLADGATMTLNTNAKVAGNVSAEEGSLTVSGNSSITGNVDTKDLTVAASKTFSAKQVTVSGHATLNSSAKVTANVVLTDDATMTLDAAQVTGNVAAEAGNLSVIGNASITGDVDAAGLELAAEKTISAAKVTVSELAKLGYNARMTADLVLTSGTELNLGSDVTLEGALTLYNGLELSGTALEEVLKLAAGESYTLFKGVEALNLEQAAAQAVTLSGMETLAATTFGAVSDETAMDEAQASAGAYFSNLAGNSDLVLSYNSADGTVSIVNTAQAVPEPATATLSLLALAALAARRRRRA